MPFGQFIIKNKEIYPLVNTSRVNESWQISQKGPRNTLKSNNYITTDSSITERNSTRNYASSANTSFHTGQDSSIKFSNPYYGNTTAVEL